ncbi:hypothetical protein E1A91_A08G209600v1 [Gossypium mustelinum]|uniref:Uncharacterized protein n=1 Tax=Gossypium mustelinum TaxID=34275 RepID=A0A5D2YC11_GOSMU|nr:hypothetical protein E1A91_A08G209600v1 [Gossypium mustelinum]
MTNRGFEVVHATLDMIQPHQEPIWELPSFGLPPTSTDTERNELSQWVEQVTEPVINELRTETSMVLMMLLLDCAVAISVDDLSEAHTMLLEITQMASPHAVSCDYETVRGAFRAFDDASPFIKFACFTSNRAMLEAFHLDIMQGLQWSALFHTLATRTEGPPFVTITGLGSSMKLLVETGNQLSNIARQFGIPFDFHPIAKKFGEIDIETVQLQRGEAVAIHWLQHSLYDATGPNQNTLKHIEQLAPTVLTLVEQDLSHQGSFLDRFVNSLHYYSTIFDSFGSYLSAEDPNRHRIEYCLLYREIKNVLAIGGPARTRDDKFEHNWRSELARNRKFQLMPISSKTMAETELMLNMFWPGYGYSLVGYDGTLRVGWKETCLFTASAWTMTTVHDGSGWSG